MPPTSQPRDSGIWSTFVRSVVVALVAGLALAVWQGREALLLAFAAAVVASILLATADPLERALGLSRRFAVGLAVAGIAITLAAFFLLVGTELRSQIGFLSGALPDAVDVINRRFGIDLEEVVSTARSSGQQAGSSVWTSLAQSAIGNLFSAGSVIVGALAGLVIVMVGGIFLALDPARYARGIVLLFPAERHPQVERALADCGSALHRWLLAQLLAMAIVGLLSGLGAWWIGLPAPLAIGVIAGLTEFIPIVGPWIGALPALLLAASGGMELVVWTGALFLAVQQLEFNVISPLVQERMADAPPFLVLFGVLALGLLFGPLGVLVSAPLTIVCYVAVTRLYVRDTLGQDVPVPGAAPPAVEDGHGTSGEPAR